MSSSIHVAFAMHMAKLELGVTPENHPLWNLCVACPMKVMSQQEHQSAINIELTTEIKEASSIQIVQ